MLGIGAAVGVNLGIVDVHSAAWELTLTVLPSMSRGGAGKLTLNFAASSAMRAYICAVS
jgi:hypothetical protein